MDQRNHPRKNSSLNDCLDNSDNYIPHIFALITKAAESFKDQVTDKKSTNLIDRNRFKGSWEPVDQISQNVILL